MRQVLCAALAVTGALLSLPPRPQPAYDPLRDSLPRDDVQPIYSTDLNDPWNRTFHLLFTRSLRAGVLDERAPFSLDAPPLTGRTITRIESGDRAVDPLYPSWTWMGSTAFDMSPEGHWRILGDPRYADLVAALKALPPAARSKPPLARALMQADLWAAYDTLRTLQPGPGRRASPDALQRMDRAAALGPLLGEAIAALALTRAEIAGLPDNYAAAVRARELPPIFDAGSGWLEVRSSRSHEQAAMDRRVARVFLEPASAASNPSAWLEQLRDESGDSGSASGAALVIQLLLIADDGAVVASPLTFDVQLRTREGGAVRFDEYELSRQRLLSDARGPGFVHADALSAAYLAMAGNDLSFATPFSLQGDPVVAPMRARCAACHGAGFGTLFTFSTHGRSTAEWQKRDDPLRGGEVARRKMASEGYVALQALMPSPPRRPR